MDKQSYFDPNLGRIVTVGEEPEAPAPAPEPEPEAEATGERARNDKGHYVKDDPNTPENEAYTDGKTPTKKKAAAKKNTKKK
tara:strand:- start:285 stop:530 length:246 start_codon:yes stop_codon:yes gene_type:complete